ncbi:MAG: hypothetical protein GIX03_02310 [Candidatus Eremiobacteraeota bacterium]|nr:hypothetical protein [Candidatus Eremiobacteraeota bacterium]MBC5801851.1 hypothetical protein [Candidatus Eremiobacteraeota bacterium]MBC5820993.1 hypothetical protein [Candidatus Eremiobacteraeota bacterium]
MNLNDLRTLARFGVPMRPLALGTTTVGNHKLGTDAAAKNSSAASSPITAREPAGRGDEVRPLPR